MKEVAHLCHDDVVEFVHDYFPRTGPTLFIGNVGFSPDVLYFPTLLHALTNVQFRFMHEMRPGVTAAITQLAGQRRTQLQALAAGRFEVRNVSILSTADAAPVGGRNACTQVRDWLQQAQYTDVVVDVTGMSRGTSFPVIKLLWQLAHHQPFNVHVLVADSDRPTRPIRSVSHDRADWMHGFPAASEMDDYAKALRLWVVQLAEHAGPSLQTMFKHLNTPDEVCPVLPFPSANPHRADQLLLELREYWQDEWGETPLSFIHAHESDPMDVYRTISLLHESRSEALQGAGLPSLTILSPVGRRVPGVGMLLASLAYDLPMLYLETVGYDVVGNLAEGSQDTPAHRWYFRVDEHPSTP